MIEEGLPAPDFELATDVGERVRLSELRGRPVVLYFYPADDTPGCTRQACEIRDEWSRFRERGAVVLGVSPDDETSHARFRDKYSLPFTLLADPEHEVAEEYGVWVERNRYGRKSMGIERSTFVIDEDGNVARILRRVKPEGHAERVLEALPG
jgi:thioredoxin-dependent peroxiredoxin